MSDAKDLNITSMLVGAHGIGKSQIIKQVARDMNGYCYTIEGGSLKEGEITGLPFAQQNSDGSSEVRFIKYYAINKIWQLERFYYEQAKTKGFLNGTVKLIVDEEGNETLVENGKSQVVKTVVDKVEAGEDNKYKFGDELSPETKLQLIEKGEIKPVILFVDELNRTEQQTMKELMNIILNKSINGYNLPWFVSIVSAINPCSQNSTYATNELDDAQLDRFLKLKVEANLEDWIDYSLEKKVNSDVIEGLAIAENIFIHREKGQEDTSEMQPSPRSWEMVANIYTYIHDAVKTKFFSDEERKGVNDDMRVLIRGKVGETAARTLLENINRKENNIKPAEILTAKSLKIDAPIVTKFNNQKRLTQKIIADNVVNYVANTIGEIEKGKTSTDAKKKEVYANYMSQLKEFTNLLDTATQILFVKKFLKMPNGVQLFGKVSKAFSKDVLANISEAKVAIKDLSNE
jgi:MoxR-like ATPase